MSENILIPSITKEIIREKYEYFSFELSVAIVKQTRGARSW